jgi:hypothetical protein
MDVENIDALNPAELDALLERALDPQVPIEVFYAVLERIGPHEQPTGAGSGPAGAEAPGQGHAQAQAQAQAQAHAAQGLRPAPPAVQAGTPPSNAAAPASPAGPASAHPHAPQHPPAHQGSQAPYPVPASQGSPTPVGGAASQASNFPRQQSKASPGSAALQANPPRAGQPPHLPQTPPPTQAASSAQTPGARRIAQHGPPPRGFVAPAPDTEATTVLRSVTDAGAPDIPASASAPTTTLPVVPASELDDRAANPAAPDGRPSSGPEARGERGDATTAS